MVIWGLHLHVNMLPSLLRQSNEMIFAMSVNMNETFSYLLLNTRTGLIIKETLSGNVNVTVA
jgi:hypothetical protein